MKNVRKLISANIILVFVTFMSIIYLIYSQKQIDNLNNKIIKINNSNRKRMLNEEEILREKMRKNDIRYYEEEILKLRNEIEDFKRKEELDEKSSEILEELREAYRRVYLEDIQNLKIKLRAESDFLNIFWEEINELGFELLSIYDYDMLNRMPYRSGYCVVGKNLELIDKLKLLAKDISLYTMNGLEIEIDSLYVQADKKIAVVNLKEEVNIDEKPVYPSWKTNRFLGEMNGLRTEEVLIESFLQREFHGDWIDGVEFLYNGSEINYDDVEEFENIIYKKYRIQEREVGEYMPRNQLIKKYLLSDERDVGIVYEKYIVEKQDDKVHMRYTWDRKTADRVFKYSKDSIKEIYYIEGFKDDNYQYNKGQDYFELEDNRDRIIINGPIKIGNSWVNKKPVNTVNVITGIYDDCETEFGSKDILEITRINDDNLYRDYYIKGIGGYKSIVVYDRVNGPNQNVKLIKITKKNENNDRDFSTQSN